MLQRASRNDYQRLYGASVRPAAKRHCGKPYKTRLFQRALRRHRLRAGTQLRLLHGKYASGFPEIHGKSLLQNRRRILLYGIFPVQNFDAFQRRKGYSERVHRLSFQKQVENCCGVGVGQSRNQVFLPRAAIHEPRSAGKRQKSRVGRQGYHRFQEKGRSGRRHRTFVRYAAYDGRESRQVDKFSERNVAFCDETSRKVRYARQNPVLRLRIQDGFAVAHLARTST